MAQTPDLVLFSLINNNSNDAFERALRAHSPAANVLRIKTCGELWKRIKLNPRQPRMIIVMDEGIFGEDVDPSFVQIFLDYLKRGGKLVFAYRFIMASKRNIEAFFANTFGLGWTKGDFYSGNFVTNKNTLDYIPNFAALPEYYNNLGDFKQQSLDTLTRAILIKDARPHERIYVPCATFEPIKEWSEFYPKANIERAKYEPKKWTFDPYTYDIDPTGISTRPLQDDQTILAGAAFDEGYVFLSGNCYYNARFWHIIDAILLPSKESKLREFEKQAAKEPNPDGSWDGSPIIHKKREIVPKERSIYAPPGRPGSPSSDPENPWLYIPKPPCHMCQPSVFPAGIERECDRGSPCSQCLARDCTDWCEYRGFVERWYKGVAYSTWNIWKPEEIEKHDPEWEKRPTDMMPDKLTDMMLAIQERFPNGLPSTSNCVVS